MEPPPVWQWAEAEYRLTKAYVLPGKFRAHAWQKEPLDAIRHYDKVMFAGPVQTGKSLLAEICVAYAMRHWSLSGMLMYANTVKCEQVLKYRLRPAIAQIPAMRQLWSGKEDDLTVKNLELLNCVWGIASAQNPSDIASFPAIFGYASECAKYEEKSYNPLDMLRGRQQAALSIGMHKLLYESSPWEVGDIFYREIYQRGTLILTPHFKCPHCSDWIVFTDSQIVETGVRDHDPARIRAEKESAVRYECNSCGHEITEIDRCRMLERCVWAADEIVEGRFHQAAETITEAGEVIGDRNRIDAVCFNWNRLIDVGYKFYECLARYFSARVSPDKFRVYETEDQARFWRGKSGDRPSGEELRAKCSNYSMVGPIPQGVVIALCGIDTMDDGFAWAIRGFGQNMESWLLRHGFIECSVKNEIYKSKEAVLNRIREEIEQSPLKYEDGRTLPIFFGLQDRGGHRPADVDYICKNVPWLHSYIGLTRVDIKKPLVQKATEAKWYLGQTHLLSEKVAAYMEMDSWHLPQDVGGDYLEQVVAQYSVESEDNFGQQKIKWVCERSDHFRDCENYIMAGVIALKLDEKLMTKDGVMAVIAKQVALSKPKPPPTPEQKKTREPYRPMRSNRPVRRWSR
jgi:phage terminase large subunit GpA-like protein